MKKIFVITGITLLLFALFSGCRNQNGAAPGQDASAEPAQLASTEAEPTVFPTLPAVIDDSDFEQVDGPLSTNVILGYDWCGYYEDVEIPPREKPWNEMTREEQEQRVKELGFFCYITNAEGEQLEISTMEPDTYGNTTMRVIDSGGMDQTSDFSVPYSNSFTFTQMKDERPRGYHVNWRGAGLYVTVRGDHMGDVRITTSGLSFSGRAVHYETVHPQNVSVSIMYHFDLDGKDMFRYLEVFCREADDFLLTRVGKGYTVLCSHHCAVKIYNYSSSEGGYQGSKSEGVPAGSAWYVEDFSVPMEELKTGLR